MKIIGLKTTFFQHSILRRMGDANSPSGRNKGGGCVIELITDEEIKGITTGNHASIPTITALVNDTLLGEDPRNVTGLWQRMVERFFKSGHDGLANDAISSLDVAMWDLKAKYNEEPLWKTLGASKNKVTAYASGLDMPLSDDEIYIWYKNMAVKYGMTSGKLKVGLDQDADLHRIGKMRDGLAHATNHPQLYIDANEFWSPKQAIRKVREMEEQYDIAWVEEPARRWDFLGMKRVSDGIKAPVVAGENLDTLGDFLPYFHTRCADIIQASHGQTGITCAIQIADTALGFELPVTFGGGVPNAHLAAALPNAIAWEATDPEEIDPSNRVFNSDITLKNGQVILGNLPGVGITINNQILESKKVKEITSSSGPSPFGRRPGAGLWDNPPTTLERSLAAGDTDVAFSYHPKF